MTHEYIVLIDKDINTQDNKFHLQGGREPGVPKQESSCDSTLPPPKAQQLLNADYILRDTSPASCQITRGYALLASITAT